ncbi:MAG: hypothetical protein QGH73_11885 [Rhodospirillales bacterium]|jgi:hypothetical protein|nr:hypothetical protein [Rhodospirillaceae bacterium]MDP6429458.1 hypothetical protein [Rhodospirillales bacterium]MDP6645851.1 hypothetical protein [Rhodospirillales bacterium]MDP6842370.1 hypothetical protein [Rhodospirillales bacterium]|tara:strand:+ start:619 stop:873 length:255 start_codon:yes stop_codon:yes gene_type:complete
MIDGAALESVTVLVVEDEALSLRFASRIRYGAVPQYKDVPVRMLTGQDTDDNVNRARIDKINGFIVKPPKADPLEIHMKKALGL